MLESEGINIMASAKIDYTPRNVSTDASGNIRVRNKVVAYHNPAKMIRGGSFFTPKGFNPNDAEAQLDRMEDIGNDVVETETVEA
jgi:hypothetical protein